MSLVELLLRETNLALYSNDFLVLIAYLFSLFLGVFILSKDYKDEKHIWFAIIAFLAAAWNLSIFFIINSTNSAEAMTYWRFYDITVLFLIGAWVKFSLLYTNKNIPTPIIFLIPLLLSPILWFTKNMISYTTFVAPFFLKTTTFLYEITNVWALVGILYGIYIIGTGYLKTSDSATKQALKYLFIGTLIVTTVGAVDTIADAVGAQVIPISNLFMIPATFFLSHAFRRGV